MSIFSINPLVYKIKKKKLKVVHYNISEPQRRLSHYLFVKPMVQKQNVFNKSCRLLCCRLIFNQPYFAVKQLTLAQKPTY